MEEIKKPSEIDDELMDSVTGGIMSPDTDISDEAQQMRDRFNQSLQTVRDQMPVPLVNDPINLPTDNSPISFPETPAVSNEILKPMDFEEIKKHAGL